MFWIWKQDELKHIVPFVSSDHRHISSMVWRHWQVTSGRCQRCLHPFCWPRRVLVQPWYLWCLLKEAKEVQPHKSIIFGLNWWTPWDWRCGAAYPHSAWNMFQPKHDQKNTKISWMWDFVYMILHILMKFSRPHMPCCWSRQQKSGARSISKVKCLMLLPWRSWIVWTQRWRPRRQRNHRSAQKLLKEAMKGS